MADLDSLRARIDAIDRDIHDLLIERSRVAEQVAAAKGRGDPALRPGREARILRRLVSRHDGPLSAAVLVRIWREILAGNTAIQGAFNVAVYVPDSQLAYWDLARDHYGSQTPVSRLADADTVVHWVADGQASAGVVPWPGDGTGGTWWPRLAGVIDDGRPQLVARLPFVAGAGAVEAAVIARAPFEDTGADRSLLALAGQDGDAVAARLAAAGVTVTGWLDRQPSPHDAAAQFLVEVDGHLASGDQRLAALAPVTPLGGYPEPIDLG